MPFNCFIFSTHTQKRGWNMNETRLSWMQPILYGILEFKQDTLRWQKNTKLTQRHALAFLLRRPRLANSSQIKTGMSEIQIFTSRILYFCTFHCLINDLLDFGQHGNNLIYSKYGSQQYWIFICCQIATCSHFRVRSVLAGPELDAIFPSSAGGLRFWPSLPPPLHRVT